MVFTTLVASGMPNSISKYTPTIKQKEQNKLVSAGLYISLVITALSIIIILACKNLFNIFAMDNLAYTMLLIMIPALIATGFYSPIRGYFWGKEMFFQSSLVEFIEQVIRIIICFILFVTIGDNLKYITPSISISIACVLSSIIGFVIFKKQKGKISSGKGFYKPLIKSSTPITAVRFLGSFIQPLITIILPLKLIEIGFTSEQALSELGITMGMTMPLLSIPFTLIGALSMALIPKVSFMKSNDNYNDLKKQINSSITFSLIAIFSIVPAFISLGEEICVVIFSNALAGKYLSYATFLMIPMGISQLTTTILNAMGFESKTFVYYAVGSVFLLASIWFLPKYLGIMCVLFGLGISSFITTILNLHKINKITHLNKYYIKEILIYSLIAIPCILLTKFIYNLIIRVLPMFISVVLSCGISFIAIMLLFICFKVINYEVIANKIKKIKTKKKTA